jgi:hypothetical protein
VLPPPAELPPITTSESDPEFDSIGLVKNTIAYVSVQYP